MRKLRLASWLCLLPFCLLFLFSMNAVGAFDTELQAFDGTPEALEGAIPEEAFPIEEAIDQLSEDLNAHIIILGSLRVHDVTLAQDRSALDNLKSILKNYSYAIIFNDPSHSYDCIGDVPLTSGEMTMKETMLASHNENEETTPDDQRDRLTSRIEQLEEQIESGEADKFLERWGKVKDPKYIFNHRKELEQLRKRMAVLD